MKIRVSAGPCMGFRAGGTWSCGSVRCQHCVPLPHSPNPAHHWAHHWARGVTLLPAVGGLQINPPNLLGVVLSLSMALPQIWIQPLNWVGLGIVCKQELPGQKAVSALSLSWAACHPHHHQWAFVLSLPRGAAFIPFWEPTFEVQVRSSELHRSQACCHTESPSTQSVFWLLPPQGSQSSTPTTAGQGALLSQEVLSPPPSLFLFQIWIPLLCWTSTGNDPTQEIWQDLSLEHVVNSDLLLPSQAKLPNLKEVDVRYTEAWWALPASDSSLLLLVRRKRFLKETDWNKPENNFWPIPVEQWVRGLGGRSCGCGVAEWSCVCWEDGTNLDPIGFFQLCDFRINII